MMPTHRSKIHSPLEANPNKYRTDALSPLEASPNKYRSRENSPDLSPTLSPYLIAWYKFDEGSGTVVYNRATDGSGGGGLLSNLTVVLQKNSFWTALSGFGSSTGNGNPDFAWNKPNRNLGPGGVAYGSFFKINGANIVSGACLNILNGAEPKVQISPETGRLNLWWSATTDNFYFDYLNQWFFIFMANDGKWRVVKNDGTVLIGTIVMPLDNMQQFIFLRFGFTYANADPPTIVYSPSSANYGDWILYSGTTLTIAKWAQWYDALRGRYGMAARSGW